MSVVFRLATPHDAATVRQLLLELGGQADQLAQGLLSVESIGLRLSQLKPPFECLIAEIDRRPVGLAIFPHLLYSVAAIRYGKEAHVFNWKTGLDYAHRANAAPAEL